MWVTVHGSVYGENSESCPDDALEIKIYGEMRLFKVTHRVN